jgi:hypothetical protein
MRQQHPHGGVDDDEDEENDDVDQTAEDDRLSGRQ